MKKLFCLVLALAMRLSASALALDYSATLGNEATFETYTEVRENAPAAMTGLMRGTPATHAVMDDFPGDTAFIYRSPDMYGKNAAIRINTTIAVYTDKQFAGKDEAKAYLEDLGLIDIINEARGAIVLVTPATPVTIGSNGAPTGGFGAADQKNYYKLQTAIFNSNAAGTNAAGEPVTYLDGSYYGT